MNRVKIILGIGLLIVGLMGTARAVPTIDTPETWTAPGIAGWNELGGVTLANPGSDGNPGGYLQAEVDSEDPLNYQIFANASTALGMFAGDQNFLSYIGAGPISAIFDFRYDDAAPAGLSLYFYSATTGNEWIRPVASLPAMGVWGSYSVPFTWDGSWDLTLGGGTEGAFMSDLLDVDRVGFWLAMPGDPSAQYVGFDNFELRIPEPNTIFFLSTVLLSLGASFRRNVAGGFRWARGLFMKA